MHTRQGESNIWDLCKFLVMIIYFTIHRPTYIQEAGSETVTHLYVESQYKFTKAVPEHSFIVI